MRSDLESVSDDQDGIAADSYLRVSTQRQLQTAAGVDEEGNSIATLREEAVRKARELGAHVARVRRTGPVRPDDCAPPCACASGALHRRAPGGAVRRDLYIRSRVLRNFTDAAITKRQLLDKGVRLISPKEEFGEGYIADAMEAITDINERSPGPDECADVAIKMAREVAQGVWRSATQVRRRQRRLVDPYPISIPRRVPSRED